MVSERQKEEIRDRVRLEDLARDCGVVLQRAGNRLRGLCPFHSEKTPSFYIHAEEQFFKCFGCQEAGDVFTFMQRIEKVTFPEALELLARKAGVDLEIEEGKRAGTSRGEKTAIFDTLTFAKDFYHRMLLEDPRGANARRYLTERGITPESWKKFELGFSAPTWDAFLKAALQKGFQRDVLEKAGLVRASTRPGQDSVYDYFRGRVMFPIADGMKRVIGFGARTLGDDQPKYLNTPKTPVFDKSKVLYALPQSRAGIEREERLAVVEGYTDAIVAHQESLDFVVASLGTAFTADNARRLRRLAPRVDIIFDGDVAGQGAAERSLALLVAEELEVRVYTVVDGKDPCDALQMLGGSEFRDKLDRDALGIFEFKWRRAIDSLPRDERGRRSAAATARAFDEVLNLLQKVPNVITQKLYISQFAEKLGVPTADVETRLRKTARSVDRVETRRETTNTDSPGNSAKKAAPEFEETVLECLLADPARAPERWSQLPGDFFTTNETRCIARAMTEQLSTGSLQPARLMSSLDLPEASGALASILARVSARVAESEETTGVLLVDSEEKWAHCLKDIQRIAFFRKRSQLEGLKVQARAQGDKEGLLEAEKQYIALLRGRLLSDRASVGNDALS